MKLRPVAAILLRQWYLLRGSPVRMLPMFAWVAIDIVLWGFITRYLNSVSGAGINFSTVLLGAVLMWDLCARVLQGVTTAFLEDVWSRNFLNMFATPAVDRRVRVRPGAGEHRHQRRGPCRDAGARGPRLRTVVLRDRLASRALSVVLYGFGVALGVLASAMVLRLGPASEWLVWPIPALLSPFCGVFYPLAVLPAWMHAISYLLPASYVFEGMRSLVLGRPLTMRPLLVAGALVIAEILVASYCFVRVYRHAVRTGLLARYSAESVS